jgi:hypothetical protein
VKTMPQEYEEKSRRIIYEFSYKMGVLNEKRCKTCKTKH